MKTIITIQHTQSIHYTNGMELLAALQESYRYADCYLPDPNYEQHLLRARQEPLTQDLVDYLCGKIDSPKNKRDCNLRFIHLQPLMLNPTVTDFDLGQYFREHAIKARRLWLRLFFLRAYALFATESDLAPLMRKFEDALRKTHDHQEYEQILSPAGLPYLVKHYGYDCFRSALETAQKEYEQVPPLLRGHFTLTEDGDMVTLLSQEEIKRRYAQYLSEINQDTGGHHHG